MLSVGIWVAADKSSFIALLKMVENENVEVRNFYCVTYGKKISSLLRTPLSFLSNHFFKISIGSNKKITFL